MTKYLIFNNFTGGISDKPESNDLTTHAYSEGMETQKYPDRMYPDWHLKKASGSTVDSLVTGMTVAEIATVATLYMAGSTDIYTVNTANTWASVHEVGVTEDIEYYNDYIYYTQNDNVGRYGPLSVSPAFVDGWWTAGGDAVHTADFHPTHTQWNRLLIGNGRYVSTVDSSGTVIEDALDLPVGFEIVKMADYASDYVAILAKKSYGTAVPKVTEIGVFFWDGTSDSWSNYFSIPDVGAYTMINKGGVLYVFHGWSDHITISYFDGQRFIPLKSIRRELAVVSAPSMRTNAITLHRGRMLLGIENANATKTEWGGGLYSWSSPEGNYPEVLNYLTPPSIGKFGQSIGCVGTLGNLIYVSWYDGTNYGVDKMEAGEDYTGVWESNIMDMGRPDVKKYIDELKLGFKSITSGHTIALKVKVDYGSWVTVDTATTGTSLTSYKKYMGRKIQFRIDMLYKNATGYPPPEITSLYVKYHDLS